MGKSDLNKSPPLYVISFGIGALAGFLGGVIASNRVNAARRMPYAAEWERIIARDCGHVEATCMTNRVESRYWSLFCERPPVANQALREHLTLAILPVLALYQVLRENDLDMETALENVERLLTKTIRPNRRLLNALGKTPAFYNLLKWLTKPFTTRNFPPEGWQIEWVEISNDSVAFDMHSCFYLETLVVYGVPELTLVFCKMDDLIYERISPYVRWERTGTLARGDPVCDFRWTAVK